MKWIFVLLLVGCQTRDGVELDPGYTRDVDRICNVIERSGAADLEVADRTYVTATWLSQNLESQAGRALLSALQPLDAQNKARALETEAARVAIASCPLAADWKRAK